MKPPDNLPVRSGQPRKANGDAPAPRVLPRWLQIAWGIVRFALLLALALGVLIVTPLGKHLPIIQHFLTTPTKANSHTTPSSSVAKTPTAIVYPAGAPVAPSSAARLGHPLSAFVAAFGNPIVHVPGVFYGFQAFCGAGQDDCEQVTIEIGQDGQQYIGILKLATTPLHLWDSALAKQICTSYMPADAQSIRSLNPSLDEVDQIYVSAVLANIFPANVFINANGSEIQPGTFEIAYHESVPGGASFTDCQLSTGIAQT
jgi:hypothetical protein